MKTPVFERINSYSNLRKDKIRIINPTRDVEIHMHIEDVARGILNSNRGDQLFIEEMIKYYEAEFAKSVADGYPIDSYKEAAQYLRKMFK